MFKKMLLLAVVIGASAVVLKNSKISSYARSEIASIRGWCETKIPPEKEISRLRKEVGELDKDIDKVKGELAREIVEVRYLKDDTEKLRARVTDENTKILAMADAMREADDKVKYGVRFVSVGAAKEMLKDDVRRHVTNKKTLEAMESTLVSREKVRDILESQLAQLKQKKGELTAEIDGVEAELKALQLRQMESKHQFDDTRLAKIKESIKQMKKGLEVKQTELNLSPRVMDETPSASDESIDGIIAPLTGEKTGKDAAISKK